MVSRKQKKFRRNMGIVLIVLLIGLVLWFSQGFNLISPEDKWNMNNVEFVDDRFQLKPRFNNIDTLFSVGTNDPDDSIVGNDRFVRAGHQPSADKICQNKGYHSAYYLENDDIRVGSVVYWNGDRWAEQSGSYYNHLDNVKCKEKVGYQYEGNIEWKSVDTLGQDYDMINISYTNLNDEGQLKPYIIVNDIDMIEADVNNDNLFVHEFKQGDTIRLGFDLLTSGKTTPHLSINIDWTGIKTQQESESESSQDTEEDTSTTNTTTQDETTQDSNDTDDSENTNQTTEDTNLDSTQDTEDDTTNETTTQDETLQEDDNTALLFISAFIVIVGGTYLYKRKK